MKKQTAVSKAIIPMSEAATKVTVPKPTKKEVIEALMVAAEREWDANKAAADTARNTARGQLLDYIHALGTVSTAGVKEFSTWNGLSISVQITQTPTVKALIKQMDNTDYRNEFPYRQTLDRIKKALEADPKRVELLSKSPEINEMLRGIQRMYK